MHSMGDVISGMFFDQTVGDQTVGEQMSTLNINEYPYNLDGALLEWGNDLVQSDTDFSGSAPSSSQETSQPSSLSPESSQSQSEDVIMSNEQDEICYGMVIKRAIPTLAAANLRYISCTMSTSNWSAICKPFILNSAK